MGRIGEGEASLGKGKGHECCMCGDHGLPSELFACKKCGFRSQHKYCSNLYPRAESYDICNWCLSSQKHNKGEESSTSQNSSHKTTTHHHHTIKMIKKSKRDHDDDDDDHVAVERTAVNDHTRIKKQINYKLPPPSAAGRKRIINSDKIIKSDSNGKIIVKPVFRNKVRRYKLLEEVSS